MRMSTNVLAKRRGKQERSLAAHGEVLKEEAKWLV